MDRLSQLQECSLKLTELLYTSIGALQRDAPLMKVNPEIPVTCWTEEQVKKNWEGNVAKTAAKDIVETVKVIDFLIDNLPGISETEEMQMKQIEELEKQNQEADQELLKVINQGSEKLLLLQNSIKTIIEKHNIL